MAANDDVESYVDGWYILRHNFDAQSVCCMEPASQLCQWLVLGGGQLSGDWPPVSSLTIGPIWEAFGFRWLSGVSPNPSLAILAQADLPHLLFPPSLPFIPKEWEMRGIHLPCLVSGPGPGWPIFVWPFCPRLACCTPWLYS